MNENEISNILEDAVDDRGFSTSSPQRVLGQKMNPGWMFIPEGTWDSILVMTNNVTIVGRGEKTIIDGGSKNPAITIARPNVRIMNLSVRTDEGGDQNAISFTKGIAPNCSINNIKILSAGGHGIFRDSEYGSGLNMVDGCHIQNVQGHGIFAPSGAGARNIVRNNIGKNIAGDFIQWGVNASLIIGNECEDSGLIFSEDSANNQLVADNEVRYIEDRGSGNRLLDNETMED